MTTVVARAPYSAQDAPPVKPGGYYLAPDAIDAAKVIPPPPAADSPAGQADVETVLQVQAARTPEQVAWAREVEDDEVFRNASVLGAWFTAENLPATAKFFAQVETDVNALGAKKLFMRPRPPLADARVKACVHVPETSSYPSGHAVRAWLWAGLLAEMFPESRAALAERARAVSWGRVIGGAHFPSDTAAGKIFAEVVVQALLKNPATRAEIERCRAEAAGVRLKKAA